MLSLTFAGTALANDLHQVTPIVGTQFANTTVGCDEGWHFVHTDAKSDSLPSELTATFKNAGTVHVAGYVNGNSIVMYNVYVDPSDTLLSASDDISNGGNLNLSHVCVSETTTATESTTTADETTTSNETTSDVTTSDETITTETTTGSVNTQCVNCSSTSTTTTTSSVSINTLCENCTDTTTTSDETTPGGHVEELTPPSTDTIGAPTSPDASPRACSWSSPASSPPPWWSSRPRPASAANPNPGRPATEAGPTGHPAHTTRPGGFAPRVVRCVRGSWYWRTTDLWGSTRVAHAHLIRASGGEPVRLRRV